MSDYILERSRLLMLKNNCDDAVMRKVISNQIADLDERMAEV